MGTGKKGGGRRKGRKEASRKVWTLGGRRGSRLPPHGAVKMRGREQIKLGHEGGKKRGWDKSSQ